MRYQWEGRTGGLWAAGIAVLLAIGGAAAGCAGYREQRLTPPRTVVAPYDTTKGEALWAVLPLRNESGTSVADPAALTDKLVAAVEEVQGVRSVPLNRTLQAMQALGIGMPRTPAEARRLATALGVDGVVAGSITAYDPYTPSLGIALALYARPGLMVSSTEPLNPRALAARATDPSPGTATRPDDGPLAVMSAHLDGKNHQVQLDVKSFAEGRLKGHSALGWKRYLASMDLFEEFAAHHAVGGLVAQEWVRLPGGGGAAMATGEEK
jgi:hypothetical protein